MPGAQPDDGTAGAEGSTSGAEGSTPGDGDTRRERMGRRFAEMRQKFDADGDGQLNEQERAAMRRDALLNRMKRFDTDGDGKLSRNEVEENPRAGRLLGDFDSMDKDRDSFVTPAELEASMAERRARWDAARRQDGSGDEGASPHGP
jgi:Ca2+-binding EF-hand superfamily protein